MSSSIDTKKPGVCPQCGAPRSEAAGGLCPRCIMAEAAQPTDAPGTGRGTEPPSLEEVTAAFPQFEIIELIGAGGMGTVWRARQPKLNRPVALKLLPASLAERDPAFAERFEREGQLLARLHHPNIVTVHDSGRAGNFFYLLMEFVDGVNLRQAMRASRFTPQQALAIVPKICDALQYAHEEGVLHRDIKPENILLDAKGRVKLVDFGIAKLVAGVSDPGDGKPRGESDPSGVADPGYSNSNLTLGDATLGTPNYMAPEQIDKPADVDHRADIYSLGVVFYELLTGELPLGKFAPPSERSAADPRLDGIVRQALEKERDRRQQSVGEMRTQVETIVGNPGGTKVGEAAKPVASTTHPLIPSRFSRPAICGALCLLLLPVGLVFNSFATLHNASLASNDPWRWILGSPGVLLVLLSQIASAVLGWIAVTQIRRSSGKLHGLGLAVFDGLLFPLLALDSVIVWIWRIAIKMLMGRSLDTGAYLQTWNPDIAPHLVNEWATVPTVITALIVDLLIIRAVWRAVNKPADNSGAAALADSRESVMSPLAGVAMSFAVLSGILGTLAWMLIFQKARPGEALVYSILVSALLGVGLGITAWKSRGGKWAAMIGFINTAVWILCAVFDPLTAPLSPAEARAAMEQALKQEITKKLTASSERFTSLSVAVDSELKTAAVNLGGLQEMRGIEGRNAWVDVDGSLNVFNDGGDWTVQGDGALGLIHFTVPLADLMHTAQAYSDAMAQKRSRFPKSAHITRNAGTVLVHHDEVDLHYVLFATKAVGSSVSDQHNTDSLAWRDHGSFKVTEQQTFGYDREATDPFHLQINGKEYELRRGRVLVTHDDGTVEQLKLFPPIATASNPEELAKLIASARAMNEEPVTAEKLRQQLEAAEAQLHDVLKTCAPTHPFVVEVRESIGALKQKISEQTKQLGGAAASATFGPVIEREIPFNGNFIDFQSGTVFMRHPQAETTEVLAAWVRQNGIDAAVEENGPPSDSEYERFPRLAGMAGLGFAAPTCVFVRENTDTFETVRPADAETRLKIVEEKKGLTWSFASGLKPWWFRTLDGATGIVQITGTTTCGFADVS